MGMNKLLIYVISLAFSTLGCLTAKKWLVIWFWIELKSLALIPIIRAKVKPRSIEATTKYFVFQALGRVILLLGILIKFFEKGLIYIKRKYSIIKTIIIILAITLKMGIFPKHFWFIDVMKGVKFFTGFFLSVISKVIPLYIIISIRQQQTRLVFIIVGIISVIIGSSFGLQQTQLRKLIALSSIAHLGWMLLIFSKKSKNLLGIIIFISYVVMTLPIFWIGKKFSIENLSKTSKVRTKSASTIILLISILSIAGLPPLLGFFYKWVMLFFLSKSKNFLIIATLIGARLLSLYFYIQICISFYLKFWPKKKTMSYEKITFKKKLKVIPTAIFFSNIIVFLAILYVPTIVTNWVI